MDVTLSNIKEKLPLIREAINRASFLSVDGEFTGLNQSWNLNAYDTPEERFKKVKQNAEDFLLIQFGLCTFYYNSETDVYTHQAFNFYIFPRTYKGLTQDKRFFCQASSLDFLVNQDFDFNKLFKEGIPYIRASDESSIREKLVQRQAQRLEEEEGLKDNVSNGMGTPNTPCVVPQEHKDFIEHIHSQVEEFLSSEKSTVQLSPCSSYRRKLIYETIRPKFQDLCLETIPSNKGQPQIQITKVDKEEMKKRALTRIEAENDQLEEAIGFTKVVQMITESGKLMVGHNMFLDMLHIINQFCCELPENYEELKDVVKSVLPRVIDTKLMASTNPFKEYFQSTGLSETYKRVNEKPFSCPTVEPTENCSGYSTATEKLHEAGYDAYVTGLCFISLAKYLIAGHKQKKNKKNYDCAASHLIQPFVNKIFMMMSPDIPYLNLGGADLMPNRDHVYHVTFPSEWRTSDIYTIFKEHGPVFVSFINETSAFAALKHPEQSTTVSRGLAKEKSEVYKVKTYKEYCQSQQQQEMENKTEISCSSKRKASENTSPSEILPGNECLSKEISKDETPEKQSPNPKRIRSSSKLFEEPVSWE